MRKQSDKFYLIDGDGVVYSHSAKSPYFLKMTHWKSGDDRRIPFDDLMNKMSNNKDTLIKEIRGEKANRIINEYWDKVCVRWEYDGVPYKVLPRDDYEHVKGNNGNDYISLKDVPHHNFYDSLIKYCGTYFLAWYQGHLVWVDAARNYFRHYFPQVILYKFKDINVEPSSENGIMWTNVNHIKPILNLNTQKFI